PGTRALGGSSSASAGLYIPLCNKLLHSAERRLGCGIRGPPLSAELSCVTVAIRRSSSKHQRSGGSAERRSGTAPEELLRRAAGRQPEQIPRARDAPDRQERTHGGEGCGIESPRAVDARQLPQVARDQRECCAR